MIHKQDAYSVIGLMSGSSLDGVDLAYCHFRFADGQWQFTIEQADCIPYTPDWMAKLRTARSLDGRSLWHLHTSYGHLLGSILSDFIQRHQLSGKTDLIASHGHTVFHFPGQHFTTQIGDGAAIAAITGVPVVCDLRSSDVALGGSGAPIVPIGDRLLFPAYGYLLNLGGIANVTINSPGRSVAFDICSANQVLNHYAGELGHEFDINGRLAASGQVNKELLSTLDALDYYKKPAPRSLDNGFTSEIVLPVIDAYSISVEDKLATYTEHIAVQIAAQIRTASDSHQYDAKMLITGGGAFNTHLIECIRQHAAMAVEIPPAQVVSYKEALVMALIGVLRLRGEINVLSSVTGATRDSICGALYLP